MNVGSSEMLTKNVLPLFESVEILVDPLADLIKEAEMGWAQQESQEYIPKKRLIVQANQFPDQSMFVLDQQLSNLKGSLERLKFYLTDLDDLLPP